MNLPVPTGRPIIVRQRDAEVEKVGSKTHYWYSKPEQTNTDRLHYVRVTLPPDEGHDFHFHPMEEVLHVLSGTATQWLEDEKHLLGPGDAVHIPGGLVHATFNHGDEILEFIAVLVPENVDFEGPMTVEVGGDEPWASLVK